eukprot:Ihof_evm3s101 gene=Ihof_evmTU3s101
MDNNKASCGILELDCAVQSYAWGKIGTDSAVAQLSENITGFTAESNTPYAELWMGTHPKGPATLKKDGTLLRTWLADNQWALGSKVIDRFGGGELPFLLKVLSVKKALSIQAHPDKALAEKLYAANPKNYPDDNHKPEMCIAITTFTGLMGFRPLCELSEHLQQVKELRAVVGEEASKALIEYVESHPQESQKGGADPKAREVLHGVYASIMHADDALVVSQLTNLMNRLDNTSKDTHTVAEQLAYTIHQSFPGDVGVFSVFILNFVTLMPGESMFMAANEPHAYLSGDCVECMACSDNVVRAGLTPKFKDVENLLSMLTYKYGPAQEHTLHAVPFPSDKYMQMYDPPIPEFALGVITVPTATQYEMAAIDGPSLVLVLEGEGSIENTDITLMK